MKKLLYGTTALVAAGLLTGTAAAQEGIDADISGGWLGQIASISQDDGAGEGAANRRDHTFNRFGTVSIAGNTTLDNGLQVGVAFDWNTETVENEVSRDGYVWMEFGGFRLELGSRNSAPYQMAYSAPGGGGGHGFNSPLYTNATTPDGGTGTATNAAGTARGQVNISGGSEKITLFTPRFGGFQLGASYTPEAGKAPGGVSIFGGSDRDNTAAEQSEIVSIGANFVESVGELDVNIGLGWEEGDLELAAAGAEDQGEWHAGVSLGWMGWTFGGSYVDSDQGTSASDSDLTMWNFGVSYATGPWTMGAQYQSTEVELGGSALEGAVHDRRGRSGPFRGHRFLRGGTRNLVPRGHSGLRVRRGPDDGSSDDCRRERRNRYLLRNVDRLLIAPRSHSPGRADFGPPSLFVIHSAQGVVPSPVRCNDRHRLQQRGSKRWAASSG